MTSIMDKLKGLANRPYFALLKSECEALQLEIISELAREEGPPTVQASIVSAARERRKEIHATLAATFKSYAPSGTKTAVIPIVGALGEGWYADTSYTDIQDALEAATSDPQVSEIVLLCDSPGGECIGLSETADMIYAAAQQKPVNAFVSGIAASAAYHLISQANSITLTPSGEVGSVGVILLHTDLTKMLDKMGIKVTAITAGKYKAEFWPFTTLTDEAKAAAQADVDTFYASFLSAINRGRGTRVSPAMKANNYGEGRMFQAKDAHDSGLVDQVATIREAFKARADSNRATAAGRKRKGELDTL